MGTICLDRVARGSWDNGRPSVEGGAHYTIKTGRPDKSEERLSIRMGRPLFNPCGRPSVEGGAHCTIKAGRPDQSACRFVRVAREQIVE